MVRISKNHPYPRAIIGGKGYNLQALLLKDIPIPDTFVITTAEVNKIKNSGNVQSHLFSALSENKLYAVRSSALQEDSSEHSFAGIFESFLNVTHRNLPKYIFECINSSLNSVNRTYYLNSSSSTEFAVIIQEMVEAIFSGVIISNYPVTGHRDKMIIELAPGTCDAITKGEVIPDAYIVDKVQCKIIECRQGDFGNALYSQVCSLIPLLCQYVSATETIFLSSVDIEWSQTPNGIILLQARAFHK
jgi:pyruvate,water dikinase